MNPLYLPHIRSPSTCVRYLISIWHLVPRKYEKYPHGAFYVKSMTIRNLTTMNWTGRREERYQITKKIQNIWSIIPAIGLRKIVLYLAQLIYSDIQHFFNWTLEVSNWKAVANINAILQMMKNFFSWLFSVGDSQVPNEKNPYNYTMLLSFNTVTSFFLKIFPDYRGSILFFKKNGKFK